MEVIDYQIYPLHKGVLLTYSKKAKGGMQQITLENYDTDLHKQQTSDFTLDKDFSLANHTQDSEYVYFLYAEHKQFGGSSNYSPPSWVTFFKDYVLIKYNIQTAAIQQFPGSLEDIFQTYDFSVRKGIVSLGGASGSPTSGYHPSIISIDTKQPKARPSQFVNNEFKKGFTNIASLNMGETDNRYYTLITSHDNNGKGLFYKEIQENSETPNIKITVPKDRMISKLNIQSIHSRQIYSGIYRLEDDAMLAFTRRPYSTQGIVVGMLSKSTPVFNQCIPYTKFKSIDFAFDEAERKEIEQTSKKGKDANLLLSMIVQGVVSEQDKIIFMAELIQPHTHMEEAVVGTSAGPVNVMSPTFDGYKRIGILVFAVDLKGNILWDKCVPITNGTISTDFTPAALFKYYQDNSIRVWYEDQTSIKTALFKQDAPPVSEQTYTYTTAKTVNTQLETDQDQPKKSSNKKVEELYFESTVEHWYGGYFIQYGEQEITGKAFKAKQLRKERIIVYLQKIKAF